MSEARTETQAPAAAVPEPTGPGTAVAAQEALVASEAPKATVLTETEKPVEPTAPVAFDPEKITLPEGVTVDPELLGKFGEIAKAHGIPHPAAQQLIDLYNSVSKTESDKNRTAWNTLRDGWVAEVKADKDVVGKAVLDSGNGAQLRGLDAVKATVAKVLNNPELTDPKFREGLEITGFGDHPAAVRTLYQWAKALTEGGPVAAGGPSPDVGERQARPRSAAQALYPNLPQTDRMER